MHRSPLDESPAATVVPLALRVVLAAVVVEAVALVAAGGFTLVGAVAVAVPAPRAAALRARWPE